MLLGSATAVGSKDLLVNR